MTADRNADNENEAEQEGERERQVVESEVANVLFMWWTL